MIWLLVQKKDYFFQIYITLNMLGQYLYVFISYAASVNAEVLKKHRNCSVGLVLHFGQHLVIWSDIQLKNSKERRARIQCLCKGIFPSSSSGYWRGREVTLACGAEITKCICVCIYVSLRTRMYGHTDGKEQWSCLLRECIKHKREISNNQCFSQHCSNVFVFFFAAVKEMHTFCIVLSFYRC